MSQADTTTQTASPDSSRLRQPPDCGSDRWRRRRLSSRRAATAIEYCLLLSLLSIVVIAGVQQFGSGTSELFSSADANLAAAGVGGGDTDGDLPDGGDGKGNEGKGKGKNKGKEKDKGKD